MLGKIPRVKKQWWNTELKFFKQMQSSTVWKVHFTGIHSFSKCSNHTEATEGQTQSHSCHLQGCPGRSQLSAPGTLPSLRLLLLPVPCSSPLLCSQESLWWWCKLRAGPLLPGTNSFAGWQGEEGATWVSLPGHRRVNSLPCLEAAWHQAHLQGKFWALPPAWELLNQKKICLQSRPKGVPGWKKRRQEAKILLQLRV